jgi:hypothetical protein
VYGNNVRSTAKLKLVSHGGGVEVCSNFSVFMLSFVVTAVARWLRYCATNRKIAGSIPDGVIGISG